MSTNRTTVRIHRQTCVVPMLKKSNGGHAQKTVDIGISARKAAHPPGQNVTTAVKHRSLAAMTTARRSQSTDAPNAIGNIHNGPAQHRAIFFEATTAILNANNADVVAEHFTVEWTGASGYERALRRFTSKSEVSTSHDCHEPFEHHGQTVRMRKSKP